MPRRHHDAAFKKQAVELVIQSGKPITHLAKELGISVSTLHQWKADYLKAAEGVKEPFQEQVPTSASPQELFQEVRRLQKENQQLKIQREILKKAMSILGQDPPSDML